MRTWGHMCVAGDTESVIKVAGGKRGDMDKCWMERNCHGRCVVSGTCTRRTACDCELQEGQGVRVFGIRVVEKKCED